MNTRKLALAVCCLAAVGLAGCGSEQKAPPPPPPVPVPVAARRPAATAGNAGRTMTAAQQRMANVQTALNANGAQLDVDGKMGPKTVAALKAYQSAAQSEGRPAAGCARR